MRPTLLDSGFRRSDEGRGLNIQQSQFSEDIFQGFSEREVPGNLLLKPPGGLSYRCFFHLGPASNLHY